MPFFCPLFPPSLHHVCISFLCYLCVVVSYCVSICFEYPPFVSILPFKPHSIAVFLSLLGSLYSTFSFSFSSSLTSVAALFRCLGTKPLERNHIPKQIYQKRQPDRQFNYKNEQLVFTAFLLMAKTGTISSGFSALMTIGFWFKSVQFKCAKIALLWC